MTETPETQPIITRRSALFGAGITTMMAIAGSAGTLLDQAEAAFPTTGTARTTTGVNFRKGRSTRTRSMMVLPRGTHVTITGATIRGWTPVRYNGQKGFISNRYLTVVPVRATSTKTSANSRKSTPVANTGLPAARHYSGPRGVTRRGSTIAAQVHALFPAIGTIYGARSGGGDHSTGRAIDIMLPGNYRAPQQQALGAAIANWARNNARSLGITYVIWNQHIWSTQRSREGWRPMSNRGSDNANHKNHVHISYK